MKLAGWLCLGIALVACGDDKPVRTDAATVHDAPADAFAGACMASAQCGDPAMPVCCWFISPGGAGYTMCESDPASLGCHAIACRGSGDPCQTKSGAMGTCTSVPEGAIQMQFWECK